MQTAFTNIWERMGRSQELSEFQHGTMIGCHLVISPSVIFLCTKYSMVNCQFHYNKVEQQQVVGHRDSLNKFPWLSSCI
ncbi:unnamed protein product [Staurois parvus]|uniref:Uncharacterized protein n=1 Tax=Staurois parvus TaxID=386267 RepID=A0ABN9ANA6_9NEOB|nr:unnamed protein product [Staurois parvus]